MTTPEVKALVVRAEYAREIADGSKPIEYRSWGCVYRGWLAVQASKRADSGADSGRVVCFVQLVDVVKVGAGNFEWMLANPIPVKDRFGFPGRLGLFDVTAKVPAAWLKKLAGIPVVQAIARTTGKRRHVRLSDEEIMKNYTEEWNKRNTRRVAKSMDGAFETGDDSLTAY